MRWKTAEVVELLSKISDLVSHQDPGGDYDTQEIIAEKDGYRIWIKGFNTGSQEMVDPTDAEVEMVEVSDGQDSQGGCNSDREEDVIFHHRVRMALRGAGFTVVPSMDAYF